MRLTKKVFLRKDPKEVKELAMQLSEERAFQGMVRGGVGWKHMLTWNVQGQWGGLCDQEMRKWGPKGHGEQIMWGHVDYKKGLREANEELWVEK